MEPESSWHLLLIPSFLNWLQSNRIVRKLGGVFIRQNPVFHDRNKVLNRHDGMQFGDARVEGYLTFSRRFSACFTCKSAKVATIKRVSR